MKKAPKPKEARGTLSNPSTEESEKVALISAIAELKSVLKEIIALLS
ncbi:MAG: hypothetical protein ABSG57_01575 [Candidatus Bathyarchaeia archaeon]|jgi:hypothetical protein